MLAAFRVDAGADIGGGHLIRCRSLARQLESDGWRCVFATSNETLDAVPAAKLDQENIILLQHHPRGNPEAFLQTLPDMVDAVVLDNYEFDVDYEVAVKENARLVVVIDDLCRRRHKCDVLVNQNPGADRLGVFANNGISRVLAGSQYALLDAMFSEARPHALNVRSYEAILSRPIRLIVACGMTDPAGVTDRVVEALLRMDEQFEVRVILGTKALDFYRLANEAPLWPEGWHLLSDVQDMSEHMIWADLAIGSGGVSALERCCLGLPSMTIVQAENQRPGSRALAESGSTLMLDAVDDVVNSNHIRDSLSSLLGNATALADMSRAAFGTCDGMGAQRVSHEISSMLVEQA